MASQRNSPAVSFLCATASACALLAGCGERGATPAAAEAPAEEPAPVDPGPPPGSLAWAAEGGWRLPSERLEDDALRRIEVIETLGLHEAPSVLELAPGAGAWTALIAPTVAAREGRYVAAVASRDGGEAAATLAARFVERFADEALFGAIETPELGPHTPALAEPGSIAMALTVDDVATWMASGYAEKVFADVYAALAPGGGLGVIQPRGDSTGAQDPGAAAGYVQQAYVVRLAQDAGFTLAGSWELLANPADTRDHPFGVWTLEPYNLTAPWGEPPNPDFDRSVYDAIGQPDRMMLLFRKPLEPEAGSGGDQGDEGEEE